MRKVAGGPRETKYDWPGLALGRTEASISDPDLANLSLYHHKYLGRRIFTEGFEECLADRFFMTE